MAILYYASIILNHDYEYNIFPFQNPNKTKFIFYRRNLKYPPSHEDFTQLYIPTHTRATPYFVGMLAGHVYRTTKARKPDFRFPYPTLCLWTIIGGCVLWMMSLFYFFVHEYNIWASVLYALVFRLIYSAMISAFIVVSAVNTCFTGRYPMADKILTTRPKTIYILCIVITYYHTIIIGII